MSQLKPYIVSLHEDKGDKFILHFNCMAVDNEHAYDQAEDAYPNSELLTARAVDLEDVAREAINNGYNGYDLSILRDALEGVTGMSIRIFGLANTADPLILEIKKYADRLLLKNEGLGDDGDLPVDSILRRLTIGDEVYWKDPDNDFSSGFYVIASINDENNRICFADTLVLIKNDAGSCAEVLPTELTLVLYCIYSESEYKHGEDAGYWNNTDGWTEKSDATLFTSTEVTKYQQSLPLSRNNDAVWMKDTSSSTVSTQQ